MKDVSDRIMAHWRSEHRPVYVLTATKDGEHVASIENRDHRLVIHADRSSGRVILHGIDLVTRETVHWDYETADRDALALAAERGIRWLS